MAATRALALLAKEDVPGQRFGPVRPARSQVRGRLPDSLPVRSPRAPVGRASGRVVGRRVGRGGEFIDLEDYRGRLEARVGRARGMMRGVINRAMSNPKRLVFPEAIGAHPRAGLVSDM
jgi:malate dehydrogenase (oxaloacetate-decarboxylating)(NADP+)